MVSECWGFNAVSTARAIFMAKLASLSTVQYNSVEDKGGGSQRCVKEDQ